MKLRAYMIGVAPIDEQTQELINSCDFCVVTRNGRPLVVGNQFDSGDLWGMVEIESFESPRVAIVKRI